MGKKFVDVDKELAKKKPLKSYVDEYSAGKGDKPRFYPDRQYKENYDRIFNKGNDENTKHDKKESKNKKS